MILEKTEGVPFFIEEFIRSAKELKLIEKKAGAVGYFRKPMDDQALLDTIYWALSGQALAY